ncbi:MAG: hypothetical protein QXT77_07440 [Candidatus Methanomethylicaceae archaeon]
MSLIEIKAVLDVDQDCKSQKAAVGKWKRGQAHSPLLSAYCPLLRTQAHAEVGEDQ